MTSEFGVPMCGRSAASRVGPALSHERGSHGLASIGSRWIQGSKRAIGFYGRRRRHRDRGAAGFSDWLPVGAGAEWGRFPDAPGRNNFP
mgnify:CR=1 FL=1